MSLETTVAEGPTMSQTGTERYTPRVDIPAFGLRGSRLRRRIFVFGQPVYALLAMAGFVYLADLTGGPFNLLVPLTPVAAAVNFYLYGVRFPVTIEVRNGELVWSGLFSERSVPMHSVDGATVHALAVSGFTLHINGAPDMSVPMAYKEWNKFADAVNHYYPNCSLPTIRAVGRRSFRMRFFHQ
jgi:hypothetical protein